MKQLFTILAIFTSSIAYSQVGIGTQTPSTSTILHVDAAKDNTSASPSAAQQLNDFAVSSSGSVGIGTITPTEKLDVVGNVKFSGALLSNNSAGTSGQVLTSAGAGAPPTWSNLATFGDIKTGLQAADHNGWIKLDGRAITSLTTTQQAQAIALGIGANLPNASNAFLTQNGDTLGKVSGSNEKTIMQANLPNINLTSNPTSAGTPSGSVTISNTTATMQDAGSHNHSTAFKYNVGTLGTTYNEPVAGHTNSTGSSSWTNKNTTTDGNHNHTMNPHNHSATFTGTMMGDHTHTVPLGGSNTPLNITPRSLSVNIFIYLGN